MTVIEKFLGHCVEIPDTLRYDVEQGLWGECRGDSIVFGLTHPTLVLRGGVKDIDGLMEENRRVDRGEAILFAVTGKIWYFEAPVAGKVRFNTKIKENLSLIGSDPYGEGWLFRIEPESGVEAAYGTLASSSTFLESLRGTEGFKNPEGIKGGVSGMCKAVYGGITEQKI